MAGKTLYARDVEANMNVDTTFLVRASERKMTKPNRYGESKPYLALELSDRTGMIEGRVWSENLPFVENVLVKDAIVQVIGTTQAYENRVSIVITDATPVEDGDLADYVPSSERDLSQMKAEFAGLVDSIADTELRHVLTVFVASPDFEDFARAPAAHIDAYAYLGGLLEHTLNVANCALAVATTRMDIDADLLLAASLLHDYGKIDAYDPLTFTESVDGQLLDHAALTLIRLDRLVDAAGGMADETRRRLFHAVAAHETRGNYGTVPQTKEAVVLQMCNQLDTTLSAAASGTGDGIWTDTIRSLRRKFYLGGQAAAGEEPAGAPWAARAAGANEGATIDTGIPPAPAAPRSIWDEPPPDDDQEIPF
jgi:3'-5' exoribonuclease